MEGLKRGVKGCGGVEAGLRTGVEERAGVRRSVGKVGKGCGGVHGSWPGVWRGWGGCVDVCAPSQPLTASCLMLSPRALLLPPGKDLPCAPPTCQTAALNVLSSFAPTYTPAKTCLCAPPSLDAQTFTCSSLLEPAGTCSCALPHLHTQVLTCLFPDAPHWRPPPPPHRDLPLCTPSLKDLATLLLQKEIRQR